MQKITSEEYATWTGSNPKMLEELMQRIVRRELGNLPEHYQSKLEEIHHRILEKVGTNTSVDVYYKIGGYQRS